MGCEDEVIHRPTAFTFEGVERVEAAVGVGLLYTKYDRTTIVETRLLW